jgi:hypothetical protein
VITYVVVQGGEWGKPVYLLYVLTVSGVAFLCHLYSPFSYVSGSVLHQRDTVEFNLQTHAQSAKVTAVTAKPGYLVVGRQDGSICSYSLGKVAPNSPGKSSTVSTTENLLFLCDCQYEISFRRLDLGLPETLPKILRQFHLPTVGFSNELRDDAGIGRLWTLMSRYLFCHNSPPSNENTSGQLSQQSTCHFVVHAPLPLLSSSS